MQEQWAFEECDDCLVHDIKAFLVPVSTSPQDTESALSPLESVQQRFTRAQNLLHLKPHFHLSHLESDISVEGKSRDDVKLACDLSERLTQARSTSDEATKRLLLTKILAGLDQGQ
jgi:hypothetical protein